MCKEYDFPESKKKIPSKIPLNRFQFVASIRDFYANICGKKIKIIDKWQISCNCFETIEPVAKYYVNIKWHTHNILIA